MANIKQQGTLKTEKAIEDYPVDEQAAIKAIRAAKAQLKATRKAKAEKRAMDRKNEIQATWVIFRYVQNELRKGNKAVFDMMTAAGSSIQPHEGYAADKVESDKNALRAFIKANMKA